VRVKDLGGGQAEVDVETNYYIESDYDHPASMSPPAARRRVDIASAQRCGRLNRPTST
jgi:hypothetical protein